MDFSVVVPVYNNAQSLPELVRRLLKACQAVSQQFELLFVNDGSRDNSLSILNKLAETDLRVKVIGLSRNFGQHPAISSV